MALNIDLASTGNTTGVTAMTTTAGAVITSAQIRIRKIEQEDESRIDLRLRMWLAEEDFLEGRRDVWVDEIPLFLQNLSTNYLSGAQYENADNTNIQNQIRKVLEDGENAPLWNDIVGEGFSWVGLGENTVTVEMPS